MAKMKFPSYIKEAGGRMDDAVLVTRKGVSFLRVYKEREYIPSEKQKAVNMAFSTVAGDWKFLDGIIMKSWNFYSKDTPGSGYSLFLGENVVHRINGEPLVLCKGMGAELLMNFEAQPGSSSGEISCSFLQPEPGLHVTLFVRRVTEPGVKSQVSRIDAGADISSFVITGLESGAQYYVYAVVTDAVYGSAATVSPSVAAVSAAG